MSRLSHLLRVVLLIPVAVAGLGVTVGTDTASAHGFSSVVYAGLTAPERGRVRVELGLEYDLLVVSAADYGDDDPLFRQGNGAFEAGDRAGEKAALDEHAKTVRQYVTQRFSVTTEGTACTPTQDGGFDIIERDNVPYARMVLDYSCPAAESHQIRSGLFGDSEGYVTGTKTLVSYDLDLSSGSAALDKNQPSFSTKQTTGERFWEFFKLGALHLLTGLDHILFLLAVIAGSRRLREVVLAATAFTLAHSVTFILAALGLVDVPPALVEPAIALSIAVVAAWPLIRSWRRGPTPDLQPEGGHFNLDRSGWSRFGVVFCFGLIHGLGFASALGIDAPLSFTLLWSLVVFNVGLEVVQLGIIAVVFPLLVLLGRRAPAGRKWVTVVITAAVAVIGLIWFVQRAFFA